MCVGTIFHEDFLPKRAKQRILWLFLTHVNQVLV